MSKYNLCKPNQYTCKPNHSVETVDAVDHLVVLYRLSHDVGVVQTALEWVNLYSSDIIQYVHINGCTSPACAVTCGVPQGSVLGPQLFPIYAAPLSKIIRNNNLMSHSYADDTQIYITMKPRQEDTDC